MLLNDPTRGIDVATKYEIYQLLRELADAGTAILFYTTMDDGVTPANFVIGSAAFQDQLRKFLAFLRSWPQAMKQ